MKTRPIKWSDLRVELGTCFAGLGQPRVLWKDRKGRNRVYARLVGCSFVMHTAWIENADLNNPATQAVILLQVQKKLRNVIKSLRVYEATTSQNPLT